MDHHCPESIRGKSLQAMTTEELEELLRREQDTEGTPDVELIEAVLAALDARGEAPGVDVDAAWDDFRYNYSSEAPLYPVPDEAFDRTDTQIDTSIHPSARAKKPAKRKKQLRVAIAVVAVLILLIGSTMTVSGMNFWEAIALWTSETFGLSFGKSEKEAPIQNPELISLFEAVMNIDDQQEIVPRYLPEGYTCFELDTDENHIVAGFANGDSYIVIQYLKIERDNGEQFQRDDGSAEEYTVGGIIHHVSTNLGNYLAVWANERWECSISGVTDKDELLRMIDSIYSED